ncbi:hypothetical protein M9Y10_034708 [Tritrichomonas musculus]|uniref:Uncharacterized protein n=1 Tax=Tritrichomonas musculus TaxID=1915356 RepID=A0ABR2KHQ4_9EUKA
MKAESPIEVTDDRIETLESNEHSSNEDSSISVIEESNITELAFSKYLLVAPVINFCLL